MKFYCSTPGCKKRWRTVGRSGSLPRSRKCSSCHKPMTELKPARLNGHGYVLRDFPEHYNISMGCVVKNRKHHQRLQRERNLQDWQPVKESPMLSKLRKEGHRI